MRISSYGCTREVWRALKKLELYSAIASCNSYASFVLSKLPRAFITRYTHAKHEQILNYYFFNFKSFKSAEYIYILTYRTVKKGEKNFLSCPSAEIPPPRQATSINRNLLALSEEQPEYSCESGRLHESKFAARHSSSFSVHRKANFRFICAGSEALTFLDPRDILLSHRLIWVSARRCSQRHGSNLTEKKLNFV